MPRLYSADTLGPLVEIHPESLRRMAREGRIPSIKIGHTLRFDYDAVVAACSTEQRDPADVAVTPDFDAIGTTDGD